MPPRVAATVARTIGIYYGRKSQVRGREDETTIERMRDVGTRFIGQLGLELEIYEDAEGHRSGRSERNRPEWARVKSRLADPRVAVLVVDSLSRAHRNAKDLFTTADLCRRYGVRLHMLRESLTVSDDMTAAAIFQMGMIAVVAQFESDIASERMREQIKYLKGRGVYWGTTPYGYRREGRGLDARLVPGERADDVRVLCTLYARGDTLAAVAEEMDRRGIRYYDREKLPARWTVDRVRQIVGNVLLYSGYVLPKGGRSKARGIRLSGDGTLLEQLAVGFNAIRTPQIEPLLSADMAEAVIRQRLRVSKGGRRPKGLWIPMLTPLLHYRGEPCRAQTVGEMHYYATRGPRRASWDAETVEAELMDLLRGFDVPTAALTRVRAMLAARGDPAARRRSQETAQRMRARLDALDESRMAREIDAETYRRMRAEYQLTLGDAERQLNSPSDVDRLIGQLRDLGQALDRMTPTQRKLALQAMFVRVEIDDEGRLKRIAARPWLAAALRDLKAALENLPTMTPTGVGDRVGKSARRLLRLLD